MTKQLKEEVAGELLNRLEDLELPSLSWGVTTGALSRDEVLDVIAAYAVNRPGDLPEADPAEILDDLLDAAREYARRMIANAPLAVQATKQSALQGLYFDEDLTKQLRAAVRDLRQAVAEGAEVGAAAESLERLGRDLRSPFEKESKLSSAIFQTADAKEGPRAFAEKRRPAWSGR